MLNIIRIHARVPFKPRVQAPLNSLGMAFERGLAPSHIVFIISQLDEKPTWRHAAAHTVKLESCSDLGKLQKCETASYGRDEAFWDQGWRTNTPWS